MWGFLRIYKHLKNELVWALEQFEEKRRRKGGGERAFYTLDCPPPSIEVSVGAGLSPTSAKPDN